MQDNYAQDPDVALMLRVRAGDRNAFEQLVIKYQKPVINAAFRYTGNPSVAEDLAQEAFIRVYRAAPGYQPDARFTTWLFTIVRNICSNYRTREGSRDQDMQPEEDWRLPSDQRDPEQAAIRRQMRMKIRKAIAELPESLRLPLILSHYQQMGYGEVAKVLNLSPAAVKVRIHRARLMLGEKLIAAGAVTSSAMGGFHE